MLELLSISAETPRQDIFLSSLSTNVGRRVRLMVRISKVSFTLLKVYHQLGSQKMHKLL